VKLISYIKYLIYILGFSAVSNTSKKKIKSNNQNVGMPTPLIVLKFNKIDIVKYVLSYILTFLCGISASATASIVIPACSEFLKKKS